MSRASEWLASTGPWGGARARRALGGFGVAVASWVWTVRAAGELGGLVVLVALLGLGVLAFGLLRCRTRALGSAVALQGAAAVAVLALVDAPATVAGGLGVALVATFELCRWSFQRRLDPPVEGKPDRARWRHLIGVLVGGWTVGVAAVLLAAGRIDLGGWQAALAAAAALGVVGGVLAARGAPPAAR